MTRFFTKEKEKSIEEDNNSDTGSILIADADFNHNDILICATHGKIYAIHKRSGARLWRSGFPGGSMGGIVSLFVTDTDKLIVGSRGRTACLKLMTGETVWLNKMPGFGIDEVAIITTPSRFLKPKKIPVTAQDDHAPPSYEHGPPKVEDSIVISGTSGKVMAFNIETGETLWKYNCPGGWYKIPVVLVEPPSLEDGRPDQLIYVGCGKWVYCLRAADGEVLWSTKISNSKFGLNYMTLATPWSSRLAAEAYSAFSQNPTAQSRDRERDNEQKSQ